MIDNNCHPNHSTLTFVADKESVRAAMVGFPSVCPASKHKSTHFLSAIHGAPDGSEVALCQLIPSYIVSEYIKKGE